jgi:hypothetical protein
MLSIEVRSRITDFLMALDSEPDLFNLLAELEHQNQRASEHRDELLRRVETGPAGPEFSALREQVGSALQSLREWRPRRFFAALDRLDDAARRFYGDRQYINNNISRAVSSLGDAYEHTIQSQRYGDILWLLGAATNMLAAVRTTRDMLGHVAEMLVSVPPHSSTSDERFSLSLARQTRLDEFASKVAAVATIYDELANIVLPPADARPPQLLKVESGSVWIDILGVPRVIKLMVELVERTTQWMYRNYTREGRVVAIGRSVDAVEEVLGLRSQLRAAGLDTSAMDDAIAKASVVVAQQLNVLLVGEPTVVLNDRKLSIGTAVEERYLSEATMRRIES